MIKLNNGLIRKMTGHFTQLVRDEAYAVGCALVQFKKGRWFTTLLAWFVFGHLFSLFLFTNYVSLYISIVIIR